jgi:hypothetical protein
MRELLPSSSRSARPSVGLLLAGALAGGAVLLLWPRRGAAASLPVEPQRPDESMPPPIAPRDARSDTPPRTPRYEPPIPYGPPDITKGETQADVVRRLLHPSAEYADGAWFPVRLTEYHPDAPAKERKLEGGKNDRKKVPLITLEQHLADPARFPYAAVASDLVLHGAPVAYGTRVYLTLADPRLAGAVFRLVDTGGHFLEPRYPGDPERDKQIRVPGHEPLDIATKWKNATWKLSGQLTVARIDRSDVLPDPSARRPRAPNA